MEQQQKLWKTALYLRLSQEDGNTGDSGSIINQRKILTDYAAQHGLLIIDEYVDDGYTGTNFDRPGFQRMIEDIQQGKINCVITKDLSRLGRDSARTITYLDEWFPSHQVRYISVTEDIDTIDPTEGISTIMPLLTTMNEIYARDTSKKIRSALHVKMEQGQFISPFAPYGYQKDPADKNHLIVDPVSSIIIKRIFEQAAGGMSPKEIAQGLNRERVMTRAQYRASNSNTPRSLDTERQGQWTSDMICKILCDRVYLGELSQSKTRKVSFKSALTIRRAREEWITVKGTHEPIISEALFDLARTRSVARRCKPTKGFTNVFSGIVFCADCHRRMSTAQCRRKDGHNLVCMSYKTGGKDVCSNHFVSYELLYDSVLADLRNLLTISERDKETIIQSLKQEESNLPVLTLQEETLERFKLREQEIISASRKLYEDRLRGHISDMMFENLLAPYDTELQEIKKKISLLSRQLQDQAPQSDRFKHFFDLFDGIEHLEYLTKPLLQQFIDHISIEQGVYIKDERGHRVKQQKVHIYYKFIGTITELETAS
mgnify:CR=1 FL=1